MIKILIADDHPIIREGLKQIIAQAPDFTSGGEATTGQEVLDKVRSEHWDVIVLDINMPGKNGLEVLRDLHRDHPTMPVLVLSIHSEAQLGLRALQMGAAGYMTKESAPQELIEAIRIVHSGHKYISPPLAERLADSRSETRIQHPHEVLTDREFQVFKLLTEGKTPQEIAELLSISVKTVRTHRSRIHERLNVKSDVELTRYAFEHKLV
jgi:two-component system, NarL family, invasion response regulator UvrY